MRREKCAVVDNKLIAPGHYVLTLRSVKISKEALPGQFVQLACGDNPLDPLLPRPFSFLAASGGQIEILYHVVGKGTHLLSKLRRGDEVPVLGPLGNGFKIGSESGVRSSDKKVTSDERMVLVGGGVGIPPLFHLAETALKNRSAKKENIHVFLGARNKTLLLCENDFKKLGVSLTLATDDGSKGKKGLVTAPLNEFLNSLQASNSKLRTQIYTCGPTPMLKAVSALAVKQNVPCQVAVEVPMACGFGACLGCAIKVKQGPKEHRFAIACTEGPVFSGSEVLWE